MHHDRFDVELPSESETGTDGEYGRWRKIDGDEQIIAHTRHFKEGNRNEISAFEYFQGTREGIGAYEYMLRVEAVRVGGIDLNERSVDSICLEGVFKRQGSRFRENDQRDKIRRIPHSVRKKERS